MQKTILCALAAVLLAAPALAQTSPVVSLPETTVVNASPALGGLNIATPTGYDTGQFSKNVLGGSAGNPGFEPFRAKQIQQITSGASLSTTSFNSNEVDMEYDGVPQNWWANGGTATVLQTGVAAGSDVLCQEPISANAEAVYSTSTTPIYTVSTACPTAPAVGNLLLLDKIVSPTPVDGFTGTFTSGSTTVTGIPSAAVSTLLVGETLYAAGYTNDSTHNYTVQVASIVSSTSITMTYAALASGSAITVYDDQGFNRQCSPIMACYGQTTDTAFFSTCGLPCGHQTLVLDGTVGGAVTYSEVYDNTSQDNFITINGGTWTYHHWDKLAPGSASGTDTVTIFRQGGSSLAGCSWTFTPTSTATYETGTCTPTDSGGQGGLQYNLVGSSGAVIEVDNHDFRQTTGVDSTNTTEYRDPVVAVLKQWYNTGSTGAASPGVCRYGPHPASSSIDDITNASPFNHYLTNPGLNYGGGLQMPGLYQFLQMAQLVGCTPRLIEPITDTVADAQGLIDFLAGGSSTTYGAKRIADGQTTPYTSVFPKIIITPGNENWNGIFTGISLGGRAGDEYGDLAGRMHTLVGAMRARLAADSASNVQFLMTGFNYSIPSQSDVTLSEADGLEFNGYRSETVDTPSAEFITESAVPYTNFNDSGDPSGYYSFFHGAKALTCYSAACVVGNYEQNNSNFTNSGGQASQDGFVDGGFQAEVTADQVMLELQNGVQDRNLFSLAQYFDYDNGTFPHLFGAMIAMGGQGGTIYRPSFLGGWLANQATIGPMYAVSIASPDMITVPSNSNGVNPQSVPAEAAWETTNGTARALLLNNRDTAASHTITFGGAGMPPAGSTVIQKQVAPPACNSVNEATAGNSTAGVTQAVTLTTTTLTSFNPATAYTLPACSTTLLLYSVSGGGSGGSQPGGITITGAVQGH